MPETTQDGGERQGTCVRRAEQCWLSRTSSPFRSGEVLDGFKL